MKLKSTACFQYTIIKTMVTVDVYKKYLMIICTDIFKLSAATKWIKKISFYVYQDKI